MEGRGALPICRGGTISLGMGGETPAEPGSQTQPSQAPGEAPAGCLHPPHLGSLLSVVPSQFSEGSLFHPLPFPAHTLPFLRFCPPPVTFSDSHWESITFCKTLP